MKYTLLVTQRCNLACTYCYIGQRPVTMNLAVASRIVDFAYRRTPADEQIEVGFFGGEPLLELEVVREIASLLEAHPRFERDRVRMTVISNGTIFTSRVAAVLERHAMALGISCDGAPPTHDRCRRFRNGRPTAAHVAANIRRALGALGSVMVNAVYRPDTLAELPSTVEFLSSLGVRQIYLTPDLTAPWSLADAAALPAVYGAVGRRYAEWYAGGDPHFISLIDGKIAVILRGGYDARERCRMGHGEFAFTPAGRIYPCERLVGDGTDGHAIGDLERGLQLDRLFCRGAPGETANRECQDCSLREYCMHWCGCSNFFSTGRYDSVGPFQCASEKASIGAAFDVFQALEARLPGIFQEHFSGRPQANSLLFRGGATDPSRAGPSRATQT